jgi:hypothetical protein
MGRSENVCENKIMISKIPQMIIFLILDECKGYCGNHS